MDLESFQLRRKQMLEAKPKYRELCLQCCQPQFSCYCQHVQRFDAKIKFIILIHPIEVKRRIATGRMSHLCLENSELISGQDYAHNQRVNEILSDPQFQPMILYPGRQSLDLSVTRVENTAPIFQAGKIPTLFVIDGTWATAKKTMYQSQNLKKIPQVCFTPPGLSQFRVRKQPAPQCYSTIEAIHYAIELLAGHVGFEADQREHDKLLYVFDKMVGRQLEFVREARLNPKPNAYRQPRHPIGDGSSGVGFE